MGRGFSRDIKGPNLWGFSPWRCECGQDCRRIRQAGVYFVTTDTWQRRALFINTNLAKIVLEQIGDCRERGFFKLHAFVVMPDHLHVLLTPSETTIIEKAMQMIKGGSAHRMGLERPNKFPTWHSGFHDRWMRDAGEYWERKRYIQQNPVEAKLETRRLCVFVGEWPLRARR